MSKLEVYNLINALSLAQNLSWTHEKNSNLFPGAPRKAFSHPPLEILEHCLVCLVYVSRIRNYSTWRIGFGYGINSFRLHNTALYNLTKAFSLVLSPTRSTQNICLFLSLSSFICRIQNYSKIGSGYGTKSFRLHNTALYNLIKAFSLILSLTISTQMKTFAYFSISLV